MQMNIDLVELVRMSGAQKLHKSGASWHCCCPLHNGNNPTGFSIYNSSDGKQRWTCYTGSCGSGDEIDFVKIRDEVGYVEACRRLGMDMEPDRLAELQKERLELKRIEEEKQAKILSRLRQDIIETQSWIKYHENMSEKFRALWRKKGVPDSWQNYFYLGACESFRYMSSVDDKQHESPSLTIPVFDRKRDPLTIRHRLLNSVDPADKYRPERSGLGAHPYITDTDIWLDFDRALVVEGEIKAMVTYLTVDLPGLQVIGVPGKKIWRELAEMSKGRDLWVCFDPDAQDQSREFSKITGAKIIDLPIKIDDAIVDGTLSKSSILSLMRRARKAT